MTVEQLQLKVNDNRVKLSEYKGSFYADTVESNGDEFRLCQADSLGKMESILNDMGLIDVSMISNDMIK